MHTSRFERDKNLSPHSKQDPSLYILQHLSKQTKGTTHLLKHKHISIGEESLPFKIKAKFPISIKGHKLPQLKGRVTL